MRPLFLFALIATLSVSAAHAQVFVADYATGSPSPYAGVPLSFNANNGDLINRFSGTGGLNPFGIALSGNDLYVSYENGAGGSPIFRGQVSVFDATSGAVINSFLVDGSTLPLQLYQTEALAVSGNNLYVAAFTGNPAVNATIAEFNATTGAVVNESLVYGGSLATGIAVSGNHLFALSGGSVQEYDATTGALIISNISGLNASGITISEGDLFVTSGSSISEYDALGGSLINSTPASGLGSVSGIAVSGDDLFVTTSDSIDEYDVNTGQVIESNLVTGLIGPLGIAAAEVPEPCTWALMLGSLGLLAFFRLRSCRA